jgi:outer membrane biosynthesis protein TonB
VKLRWFGAALAVLIAIVVAIVTADAVATNAPQPQPAAPASPPSSPAREQLAQAQPAQPSAPKPANIDRNGVLMLVRSTILALDQANKTGNYTVLRDLGAPGFQANTAAKLAEIFASQRNDKLDLSGVAVIDPQLTVLPEIGANGLMRMAGFFPSVPSQVNFELLFAPVDGQWRLFGISVKVGSSAPVAPTPPAAPPPPVAAAKHVPPKVPKTETPKAPPNSAPKDKD